MLADSCHNNRGRTFHTEPRQLVRDEIGIGTYLSWRTSLTKESLGVKVHKLAPLSMTVKNPHPSKIPLRGAEQCFKQRSQITYRTPSFLHDIAIQI